MSTPPNSSNTSNTTSNGNSSHSPTSTAPPTPTTATTKKLVHPLSQFQEVPALTDLQGLDVFLLLKEHTDLEF